MAGSDGLPPGWETSTDPSTGRQFYINHNTMQTSWTPPVESPLPDGWEQQRDEEGRIYFVNHNTQQTQWEDPRLELSGGQSAGAGSSLGGVSYPSFGGGGGGGGNSSSGQVSGAHGASYGGSSSSSSGEWTCSACTFANASADSSCAMCGTDRNGGSSGGGGGASYASGAHYGGSGGGGGGNSTSGRSNSYDDDIDPATAAAIAAAQAEDEAYMEAVAKGNIAMIDKPSELMPYMVPDNHSSICTLCGTTFDWKNRRHHCKCCGSLLCNDCSSRKAKFSIPGLKESERRVCDLCYDHQSAGDENCFLRYVGILRDAGPDRYEDRRMALRGVADLIDLLPDAIQNSATVDQQARAMRTLDVIQRCGGAATLCEMIDATGPSDVLIQNCRVVASMAAVAANTDYSSEIVLSRSALGEVITSGSFSLHRISDVMSRPDAPWEAHMHLAHALYLLGDIPSVREAVRTGGLFPSLCDMLLATQESLQSWATMAVARLVSGDAANTSELVSSNGVQSLVLLLGSSNITVQEHAASAICSMLELENRDGDGRRLAGRVRDAMVQSGGAGAAVTLMRSDSPTAARSGLRLIKFMSNGQAEVVRAAGAVPLVIALLASQDSETQSSAAELLRNVAHCSGAGSRDVLESGGLSMAIPLLSSADTDTKANAAALCEAYAADERGAGIILDSGGVPTLVRLVGSHDNGVRGSAAGALVELLQAGQHFKQAVVNAGGVEALLGLEGSTDPFVLRQLVGAVYSFVSDENLLHSLTRRVAPSTMAMKLLQMLSNRGANALDEATEEKLLLVVAVLCGAREGDLDSEGEPDESSLPPELRTQYAQQQQTRDLVASNGAGFIVPLLETAQHKPALALAAFRLLLSVSRSPAGARGIAKAGGIAAVVRALDESLHVEGHSGDARQLVAHLRLYGLTLFGKLCGGSSSEGTLSTASRDDVHFGVKAIARVLDQQPTGGSSADRVAIQLAAVRALRSLSCHSGNWEVIASTALPQLIEMLLADDSEPALLTDIALIISNLAKLERHSDMVLDSGAVFALLGLLSEAEGEAVEAGLGTLCALAESSKRCRLAMVEQGAAAKLLHIAEQRPPPLPETALRCLVSLAGEPANGPKITAEPGTTDSLLRLIKASDSKVGENALTVLLAVAKDSENLWEQLVVNADIDSSVALLRLGPPRVQGQAVSTIAALCGDSPGFALCASPTVAEVLPVIVKLLSPPEHLGSDKSESPAKEAAAACALLSAAPVSRKALVEANVVPALVTLLLRERRLGRPRSATSEHTLQALFAFSDLVEEPQDTLEGDEDPPPQFGMWDHIQRMGKRRDTMDAVITILDAHIRDTADTPSGCDRLELCENAVELLGRLPPTLGPNEITLLGRSARSVNLLMNDVAPEPLIKACLGTLRRMAQEPFLTSILAAAGTIRTVSTLLEPLLVDPVQLKTPLDTGVILAAARMIAVLVSDSKDRSVDDAVIGTKAIPALAALLTRHAELFPAETHAAQALTAGLESISSLAQGGVAVQRAIMASGADVLAALATVVAQFDGESPVESAEAAPTESPASDVDDEEEDSDKASFDSDFSGPEKSGKPRKKAPLEKKQAPIASQPETSTKEANSPEHAVARQRATHALLTLSRLATLDEHRRLIVNAKPSILEICERILQSAADPQLIVATVQLICDLGPSVVSVAPELAAPLASNVLGKPKMCKGWRPALEALAAFCLDAPTAVSLGELGLLNSCCAIVERTVEIPKGFTVEPSLVRAATEIAASLARDPVMRDNAEMVNKFIRMASAVVTDKAASQGAESGTVEATHCLLALQSILIGQVGRDTLGKSQALVRAIKALGTAPQTDAFTAHLAAQVIASLGTGERLAPRRAAAPQAPPPAMRAPPSRTNLPSSPPTHSQPPPPPAVARKGSVGSAASSGGSMAPPSRPPPQLPSSSPLMSSASSRGGMLPPSISQAGSVMSTTSGRSLLPTYSGSVSAAGLSSRGGGDRASLELARKLQAEEQRAASGSARSPYSQQPSGGGSSSSSSSYAGGASSRSGAPQGGAGKWSCSACTFENSAGASKCEMCDSPRPGGGGRGSSGGGGLVHVRCPSCSTVLGAPADASMFQCMSCHSTSSVAGNRV